MKSLTDIWKKKNVINKKEKNTIYYLHYIFSHQYTKWPLFNTKCIIIILWSAVPRWPQSAPNRVGCAGNNRALLLASFLLTSLASPGTILTSSASAPYWTCTKPKWIKVGNRESWQRQMLTHSGSSSRTLSASTADLLKTAQR